MIEADFVYQQRPLGIFLRKKKKQDMIRLETMAQREHTKFLSIFPEIV